jgi:hypothetical protein
MSFTPEHLDLCRQVQDLVEKWRWLPWLAGWTLDVEPIDSVDGEDWEMRIETLQLVRYGKIQVTPNVEDPDTKYCFPIGEYSVELVVVHELCHVLFEDIRGHALYFHNIQNQSFYNVLDIEEEKCVWALARTLLAMETNTREALTVLRPRLRFIGHEQSDTPQGEQRVQPESEDRGSDELLVEPRVRRVGTTRDVARRDIQEPRVFQVPPTHVTVVNNAPSDTSALEGDTYRYGAFTGIGEGD